MKDLERLVRCQLLEAMLIVLKLEGSGAAKQPKFNVGKGGKVEQLNGKVPKLD